MVDWQLSCRGFVIGDDIMVGRPEVEVGEFLLLVAGVPVLQNLEGEVEIIETASTCFQYLLRRVEGLPGSRQLHVQVLVSVVP